MAKRKPKKKRGRRNYGVGTLRCDKALVDHVRDEASAEGVSQRVVADRLLRDRYEVPSMTVTEPEPKVSQSDVMKLAEGLVSAVLWDAEARMCLTVQSILHQIGRPHALRLEAGGIRVGEFVIPVANPANVWEAVERMRATLSKAAN